MHICLQGGAGFRLGRRGCHRHPSDTHARPVNIPGDTGEEERRLELGGRGAAAGPASPIALLANRCKAEDGLTLLQLQDKHFCSLTESREGSAKINAFLAEAPALYHFPPPEGGLHRRDEEMPTRRHTLLALSCVSFEGPGLKKAWGHNSSLTLAAVPTRARLRLRGFALQQLTLCLFCE